MSLRILIVDDTKFLRLMLTDILTKSGYEVVGQAENGLIGVEMYRELRPDLVIMDITMPEMDGITALKEIRGITPHSVILICSAMSQRDLISKALKAGANQYVMKPFEPERVKEVIDEVMPLIRHSQELVRQEQEEVEAAKLQQAAAANVAMRERDTKESQAEQGSSSETYDPFSLNYDPPASVQQATQADSVQPAQAVDSMDHMASNSIGHAEAQNDDHHFNPVENVIQSDEEISVTPASQTESLDEEEFGSLLQQDANKEMADVSTNDGERLPFGSSIELPTLEHQEYRSSREEAVTLESVDWAQDLTTDELEHLLSSMDGDEYEEKTISIDSYMNEPTDEGAPETVLELNAASDEGDNEVQTNLWTNTMDQEWPSKREDASSSEWSAREAMQEEVAASVETIEGEIASAPIQVESDLDNANVNHELIGAVEQAAAVEHHVDEAQALDAQYARGMGMTTTLQPVLDQERSKSNNEERGAQGLELDLKRKKMRNVESSIMCKWNDQLEGQDVNYSVIYNEFDGTIRIDMITADEKKESIQLSMDGFSFLIGWLELKGVKIEKYI